MRDYCDLCEGRAVRQSPVRPARTAGLPSWLTVALVVVGAVLLATAALLPQGTGWMGENVVGLWCGVVGLVCGVWGLVRWDGEKRR